MLLSTMASERKPEPKLAEAAARTASVMRALHERLNREAGSVPDEGAEELGNQLQEYFAAAAVSPHPRAPGDLRELVIENVVNRILRSWDQPGAGLAALKYEVLERLVERVLIEMSANPPALNRTQ